MKAINVGSYLLREAALGWSEHRAQKLGAALAFYITLAIAPLSVVAIIIAGHFFGDEAARGGIVDQIEHVMGYEGAKVVEALLHQANQPRQSRIAAVVSLGVALFAAVGVFAELKDSLDLIWEVKRKPGLGFWTLLRTQFLALVLVLGTGLLLLASLLMTAFLAAFTHWVQRWFPVTIGMAYLLDLALSFLIATLLFAMIFKLLPDVTLHWKDVGIGALVTAVLFLIGKFLIGVYIGRASLGSIYGAAGSLVVVLVWSYYSSQIVFFGAELIRAYAKHFHPGPIVPTELAVPVSEPDPARSENALNGVRAQE
jgi:membrane protein